MKKIWKENEWVPAKVECKNCKPGTCLDVRDGRWTRCLKCVKGHVRCIRRGGTAAAVAAAVAAKESRSKRGIPDKGKRPRRDDDNLGGGSGGPSRTRLSTESLETKIAETTLKLQKMEERIKGMEKLEMMRASLAKRQLDLTFETFTATGTVERSRGTVDGVTANDNGEKTRNPRPLGMLIYSDRLKLCLLTWIRGSRRGA